MITQKRLKEVLDYNQETGVFTWVKSPRNGRNGMEAGNINKANGYRYIRIDGCTRLAHRLAFLYVEGEMPPDQVDHINRNSLDNRWCNLKHSTQVENQNNKDNNALFSGVCWSTNNGKWKSSGIANKGNRKFLGYFKTHLAACYARHAWEALL